MRNEPPIVPGMPANEPIPAAPADAALAVTSAIPAEAPALDDYSIVAVEPNRPR